MFMSLSLRPPPLPTLFPYTTLFRSDFVTSPGYLAGGDSRRQAGLLFGRVARVVTTLGLFSFDPDDKRLRDRKSTRLNSSHANISYAVFCLKKKKTGYATTEVRNRAA